MRNSCKAHNVKCCCRDSEVYARSTEENLKSLDNFAKRFNDQLGQEEKTELDKRDVAKAGKVDARKHLEELTQSMMSGNIVQAMTTMLDTIVF